MDPNLVNESQEIRDWSSKVFMTLFQRQPDKSFIDPILEKSFLYKLKQLIRDENNVEAGRLIESLKFLINKAPELRLENRLLALCEISNSEVKLSIAQASICQALAPTIAPKVFRKRFYHQVMTALEEELSVDEIDDEKRLHYVLLAYAELISSLPP